MENKKTTGNKTKNAGRLFEALLDDKPRAPDAGPPASGEVRRLTRDLGAHRVELEAQNGELLAARQDTEEALRASEERFRTIAETVPVLVCITRIDDGVVMFTNEVNNKAFGLRGEDIVGTRGPDYYWDPADRAKMVALFKENGAIDNYPLKVKKSDGTPFWIMTSVRPIIYNGSPAMIGASIDITDYRKNEEALCQSEERFRAIAEASPVGIGVISVPDAKFVYVNMSYIKSFGYAEDDLLGRTTPQIYYDLADRDRILARLKENGSVADYEVRLKRKDGTPFWALASVRPITFDGKPALLGTFVDISERKQTEEKLGKVNRTLIALGKSSQAMMRAKAEAEYLREVCRIIIDECGYKMTWIGLAKDDIEKSVVPVACAGFEDGYLESLRITWADTERGRGPTGTAVRTGRPCMCRNMLTDPSFLPWRAEAVRRGYASSIVLPLMEGPKAFGALTIYSREPDPFSPEEEAMLMDLARDLAHGITAIRMREARAKAEEQALRQTEELRRNVDELERFNRAMVDRELQMVQLKKQVNELHARLGEQPPYPLAYEDDDDTKRI